tara:strand:+ start:28692 stop:29627 length:936 start_codon:yes stop_codon:yes gene_type:complete
MDTNNETPQAAQEATTTEQSQGMTTEQTQANNERQAFERHVQENGEAIPENFQNAGAWFDSLKGAQAEYTKARQEVSELKKNFADGNTENPNYVAPTEPEAPVEEAPKLDMDKLEIPEAPPEPEETVAPNGKIIQPENWATWGLEIDNNDGNLTDNTRESIKSEFGVQDAIIDEIVAGRRAMMKQAVNEAASVVGSEQELNTLMDWASKNLPSEERAKINQGLRTPAWETVMLGLKTKYESSVPSRKAKEPTSMVEQAQPTANVGSPEEPFGSRDLMLSAMRDTRYTRDPKYRAAVEEKMRITFEVQGGLM